MEQAHCEKSRNADFVFSHQKQVDFGLGDV
jgi:hypothetical protein